MKIKYFQDTDTAILELSESDVEETKAITENLYVDFDAVGNIVNITIEHASRTANLPDISLQQIKKDTMTV